MSKFSDQPIVAIVCVIAILLLSWAFNAYSMSTPERMQIFNYVMFILAPIALIFYFFDSKSFSKILSPIVTLPSVDSLAFSILLPILFLALLVGAVVLFGQGVLSRPTKRKKPGRAQLFSFFLFFGAP